MHGKKRGGFKDGNLPGNDPGIIFGTGNDDHIKGHKSDGDIIDGLEGDDLIIGFGGDDTIIGGDGEDDLNGGSGDDTLIGGTVTDNDATLGFTPGVDGVNPDGDVDKFGAEEDFAANGSDTIYGYEFSDDDTDNDDVIDLSDALDFGAIDASDGVVDGNLANLDDYVQFAGGVLSVDPTGAGDFDSDDDTNDDAWFTVYTDNGATLADNVVIEIDGNLLLL